LIIRPSAKLYIHGYKYSCTFEHIPQPLEPQDYIIESDKFNYMTVSPTFIETQTVSKYKHAQIMNSPSFASLTWSSIWQDSPTNPPSYICWTTL